MKILYFAWLRERLNRGSDDVNPPADVLTITDLIEWLCSRDPAADHALTDRNIVKAAIDGRIVPHSASVIGATTVALLPPMTGG